MNNSRKKLRYCFHSDTNSIKNETNLPSIETTNNIANKNNKLMQDSYRLRLESSIMADWKRKQILAETDNYKNHLREAMMSSHSPATSPIVENAGIMQAIEEFGLVSRRLRDQFLTENLETHPSRNTTNPPNINIIDEFAVTAAIHSKGLSL